MKTKGLLFFIQWTVFIAFTAMTIPYAIIPKLFLSIESNEVFNVLFWPVEGKNFIGLILGIYPLGLFLGSLLFGYLTDIYSKRKLLLVSLFFSCLTQTLSGYFVLNHEISILLITRLLSGFFEGNIVIARTMTATLCPEESEKRLQFGRTNAAITLGWSIGPLIGAVFSDSHIIPFFHYDTPFFVSALLTCSTWIICFFKFPKKTTVGTTKKIHSDIQPNVSNNIIGMKMLLFFIFSLLVTLGIDAFYQYLPVYLSAKLNYTSYLLGLSVSTVAIFNTISNIAITPYIGKKFKTETTIILSTLLLCLVFSLLAFTKHTYILFPILIIIGVLIALTMTNMTVFISTRSADHLQGRIMGIISSQRTLGTGLITFLIAPLLVYGYNTPFIIGACLIFAGMLLITTQAKV